MENQLIGQFLTGFTWRMAWGVRLRLMDAKNRLPRGFTEFSLSVCVDGSHPAGFTIAVSATPPLHILDIPEVTLQQLDLHNAAYGDNFTPRYAAMDDGIDQPGGCWHLFELRPCFDPVSLEWQSEGDIWEIGLDPSDDLCDTPEFQRWVKPGYSLVRIVAETDTEPRHHPLAFMDKASWRVAQNDPAQAECGSESGTPKLLGSTDDRGTQR
jgi:hypothetical protein